MNFSKGQSLIVSAVLVSGWSVACGSDGASHAGAQGASVGGAQGNAQGGTWNETPFDDEDAGVTTSEIRIRRFPRGGRGGTSSTGGTSTTGGTGGTTTTGGTTSSGGSGGTTGGTTGSGGSGGTTGGTTSSGGSGGTTGGTTSSGGSGGTTGGTTSSGGTGGTTAGTGGSGSSSSGGTATYPVKISSDKNCLTDATGKPFIVKAEGAFSLMAELNDADTVTYLDSRKAHGFNTILVNLIEPYFTSHSPKWRNAAGDVPFNNADDWTALNEAYFAHVDWVLQQAANRGILVLLEPAYIGYACGSEGWCSRMRNNGVSKLTTYGTYVGNRYKSYPNIVWVQGGDYTPSGADLDNVNAVANGIKAGVGGVHLHAAHWGEEISGLEGPSVTWLNVDTTYTYSTPHVYQKTLSDRARDVGKRPFFLLESSFENEHSTTNLQLRAQMYQPMLSGGTGFLFGNFPIWSFWDPGDPAWQFDNGKYPNGWKSALDGGGTKVATTTFAFFDSIPWQTLAPDTGHAVLTSGYGSGDSYALCAIDSARKLAVTYLTSKLTLTFDMSKFAGPVTARWFDPAKGTYTDAASGTVPNSGTKTFTPSGNNGDGSADWVLVLSVN